ncbi:hypothetical protein J2S43_001202 [Catenuloplanes nepalensis]|uniref:Uncharacterized protein n=1 Tax=Catenuloplanes nepalensis TaxID=587533 RepID=A0ABT9MMQ2_9ACTN|nr:hypothetical protein [Catenuloplanes nepalensis]MDP9792690.1 hypothetical protein [Catenuloplanes nepalensis]
MPGIVVDEAFILRVIGRLGGIRDEIPPLQGGRDADTPQKLDQLLIQIGTFVPAEDLGVTVTESGGGIWSRLDASRNRVHELVTGLSDFLAESETVESLNSFEATEIQHYLGAGSA